MKNLPIIDYRTLKLKSLDIILCEGFGVLSRRIAGLQRLVGADADAKDITHVAAVYREPTIPLV